MKSLAVAIAFTASCAPLVDDSAIDTTSGADQADIGPLQDDGAVAGAIVQFVGSATLESLTLPDEAGLPLRAAENIIAYRTGDDGIPNTDDDENIDDIHELDFIPFIGRPEFDKLVAYVTRPATCDTREADRLVVEMAQVFSHNMTTRMCIPPTVLEEAGVRIEICANQTCHGVPGCIVDLAVPLSTATRIDGDDTDGRLGTGALSAEIAAPISISAKRTATSDGTETSCAMNARWKSTYTNAKGLYADDGRVLVRGPVGDLVSEIDVTGCDLDTEQRVEEHLVLAFHDQLAVEARRSDGGYVTCH